MQNRPDLIPAVPLSDIHFVIDCVLPVSRFLYHLLTNNSYDDCLLGIGALLHSLTNLGKRTLLVLSHTEVVASQ